MKNPCHRLATRYVSHPALAAATLLALLGLTMAAEPVAPGQASPATAAVDAIAQKPQQAMIGSPSTPTGQQAYVAFSKTFKLGDVPKAARLHLVADSRSMPLTDYWLILEFYRTNTPQLDQTALDEIRRRWTAIVKQRKDTGALPAGSHTGQIFK